MKKWLFIISILGLMLGSFGLAQEKIEINFFYSQTCPHCAAEKEFLAGLKEKYPGVEIKEYEITLSSENQRILKDFYSQYQVPERERGWVPVTFTPTKYFVGFSQPIAAAIENCLKECLGEGKATLQTIQLPFFGQLDIAQMSLPLLTVVLGALDGFNPCAMWVLLFLIALLVNTRSRQRIWLVGGTFVAVSGIIYFLILSAWLNLFLVISYVHLTRILIGTLAIGVGLWQLKNFITYHPSLCRAVGLKARLENGLKARAEKIAASSLTWAMVGGVIFLALGVNLIEFFCSAGFPAIFTRILALSELNTFSYYFYLLLYTFVFMLDDLIVFSLAVITLNRIGFTEKYNYWATLVGGLLILILGILLIFKPALLMFA